MQRKIFHKREALREELTKAEAKLDNADDKLSKLKKKKRKIDQRKTAFDRGLEEKFHEFKSAEEARRACKRLLTQWSKHGKFGRVRPS